MGEENKLLELDDDVIEKNDLTKNISKSEIDACIESVKSKFLSTKGIDQDRLLNQIPIAQDILYSMYIDNKDVTEIPMDFKI